jgi:hypothetical protein
VVGELLGDLMNRGIDFSTPRLYVLDAGKALHASPDISRAMRFRAADEPKSYLGEAVIGDGVYEPDKWAEWQGGSEPRGGKRLFRLSSGCFKARLHNVIAAVLISSIGEG